MSLKLCVRYKIDLSALEDQTEPCGRRKNTTEPIGSVTEYVGNPEDVKRRICSEIDRMYLMIEDAFYGEGD